MQKKIPAYDGLRGAAMLVVVYQHAARGIAVGPLSVEVFLTLSGFLIGGIVLDTAGMPGWLSSFYLRRTLRIWPLYFLTVFILVATDPFVKDKSGLTPWMLFVFLGNLAAMTQPHHRWGGITWTVSVEEHFYLLLPPLVATVRRNLLPAILLIAVASAIVCRQHFSETQSYEWVFFCTPCRIDLLAWGVLGAWIARERRAWARWAPAVVLVATVLEAYTIATGPVMSERAIGPLGHRHMSWIDAGFWQSVGSVGTSALLVALDDDRLRWIGRVLSTRVLQFYGRISYGVYLLHGMVVEVVNTHWRMHPRPRYVLVLAVTTVLGAISWRWFERPILGLSKSHTELGREDAVPALSVE